MAMSNLQNGIESVQQGNHAEGARLLKFALKNAQLDPRMQATALMWLAETKSDPAFKLECYQKASQIDPTNATVNERLSAMLNQQLPPAAAPQMNPNQGQPPYQNPQYPAGDSGQYFVQNPLPQQPAPNNYPVTGDSGQYFVQNPMPQHPPQANYPVNQPSVNNPYPQNDYEYPYGAQQQPPAAYPPVQPARGTGAYPAVNPQQNMNELAQSHHAAPTQFQPNTAMHIQGAQRSVGIVDAVNGRASGFFVTRNGLIVTSRFAIGGIEELTIELASREYLYGIVVRAFPEYDLALIQVNATVSQLMPVTPTPVLPENAELVAIVHPGQSIRSSRRITRHETAPYWFPTTTNKAIDAGGNPIYSGNTLVGMLTQNASRSNGYFYGLHIAKIYECVEHYTQEAAQLAAMQTIYCRHCGIISRAKNFAGYYCEHCGAVH
ncbi:MAG: hypothetical protein ACPG7F_09485, partial [Aggregatilineales bacterium]